MQKHLLLKLQRFGAEGWFMQNRTYVLTRKEFVCNQMILSKSKEDRCEALNKILPFQKIF